MVVYTYHGKSGYIDDRLAKDIDDTIIPDLMDKDSDGVFCVDGGEGSGKSKFSDLLCGYVASSILKHYKLDVNYSVDSFALSPQQFRNTILHAKKNSIVVYDEAHKGMGARRSLSEINNILVDLMMEMRQKNLLVILVLPTFFMLDKYAAIFRTKGLFHIYRGKNPKTGKREKGFWVYFNEKYKLLLYIKGKQYLNYNCIEWPSYTGRFYNQYIIDEKAYREKKVQAFKQHGKRETKAEVYLEQRNSVIYALYTELNIGSPTLTKKLAQYGLHLSQAGVEKAVLSAKMALEHKKKHQEDSGEPEKEDSSEENEEED